MAWPYDYIPSCKKKNGITDKIFDFHFFIYSNATFHGASNGVFSFLKFGLEVADFQILTNGTTAGREKKGTTDIERDALHFV